MRLLRDLPDPSAASPMSMGQRWLCVALLVIAAPLWLPALIVIGVVLATHSLFRPRASARPPTTPHQHSPASTNVTPHQASQP